MISIFLSFLQSKINYPIPSYSFWEHYIKNGIEESGSKFIEGNDLDWAKGLYLNEGIEFSTWKTDIWSKTLEQIIKQPVDLFLCYLYPHMVDTNAIKEIQKLGIPCVNFFCDNVRDFDKAPEQFKIFDLNWVPERAAYLKYTEEKMNVINLPMPMWVEPKYRNNSREKNSNISFIGSQDFERDKFICQVNKISGQKIDVFGRARVHETINLSLQSRITNQFDFILENGFVSWLNKVQNTLLLKTKELSQIDEIKRYYKGELDPGEYIEVTRSSKVTVGINRYFDIKSKNNSVLKYSKLRDIEAPMLGACYLTEHTVGIEQLYDIEKEILVYHCVDDFVDKTERLFRDHVLRNSMRNNCARRALSEHSIPKTLNIIFKSLGIVS